MQTNDAKSGSSESLLELTDQTFEQEVIGSEQPVLVDFWAPWCGPCRAVSPTIEALAEEFSGRVKVAKMNVDENQGVAGALRIMSIPTVALFQGNKVLDVRVGAFPRAEYAAMLEKAQAGGQA